MDEKERRMPRVSIGLPVYNGENYLRDAVESILSQSFDDFELLISDNGSTDATPDLCREYAAADSRIHLELNTTNRGAAWNYNHVFRLARGDFFKWASHDDMISSNYLQRCMERLDDHPEAVLCYPRTVLIDQYGVDQKPYQDGLHLVSTDPVERFRRVLFRKAKKCHPVLGLIRRSALARTDCIGCFNASDQVLLAHLALLGEFHEIPEAALFRRDHPETSLRANRSAREVATWFDPTRRRKLVVPALRLSFEYLRCLGKSDLGVVEKLSCGRLVMKRLWWDRHQVAGEMKSALTNVVTG